MFFKIFFVIVGVTSLNAQIFNDEVKLSNSQDVTHLRVEYYRKNDALETDSLTYSLWKGNMS